MGFGVGARSGATAPYHGGDLAAARLRFRRAPEPWIDLSTGINPLAYPVGTLPADAWQRLPEPAAVAALERAAARAYGANSSDLVVAAPGTQALIQWLPYLLSGRRVAILGETYAEHAACWRAAGAAVEIAQDLDGMAGAEIAVVVNPNNPDGRLVPAADLRRLAQDQARRGCMLIVDEAFMDVIRPGHSLVPVLPDAGAVVLRSFGKAFGLAGLRLGFAVAPPPIADALRGALGPWAVSGPAIAVAGWALADRAWLDGALVRLVADTARLDQLLAAAGFRAAGGTPLFRLAAHPAAPAWFAHLGAAGILVRPYAERPERLRFGLPGNEAAWARLEACLARPPAGG